MPPTPWSPLSRPKTVFAGLDQLACYLGVNSYASALRTVCVTQPPVTKRHGFTVLRTTLGPTSCQLRVISTLLLRVVGRRVIGLRLEGRSRLSSYRIWSRVVSYESPLRCLPLANPPGLDSDCFGLNFDKKKFRGPAAQEIQPQMQHSTTYSSEHRGVPPVRTYYTADHWFVVKFQ